MARPGGQRVVDILLVWIGESNESAKIAQLIPSHGFP